MLQTNDRTAAARKVHPLKLAKAVAWSFFGVRKGHDHQDDIASLTLVQLIIGGVLGGAMIVACFVTIARVATS
jgi:hypothetical protein